MRLLKKVVNFIVLGLFFDHLLGEERPHEWIDGDIWIWQHPSKEEK